MSITLQSEPVPLSSDESGVIRVSGTRVTLDTIIAAHQQGETPEVIADQYPTVALVDIYAAITFYLRHREEIEAYLDQRRRQGEAVRRKHESRFSQEGLREELLARRRAESHES
jgi:uncharacterized protein (DUF433 family)